MESNPSASGVTTSNSQVRDRLDNIEINIPMMDVADRLGQEKDDTCNTAQEVGFGTRQGVT
jgi:hypothetical protein